MANLFDDLRNESADVRLNAALLIVVDLYCCDLYAVPL